MQAVETTGWRTALAGSQMLFVAFGALVLMPLITGMDPSVALFTAGIGTLIFQFTTQRQVPVFLASSFAFIAPILYSNQTWGLPATLGGLLAISCLAWLCACAAQDLSNACCRPWSSARSLWSLVWDWPPWP